MKHLKTILILTLALISKLSFSQITITTQQGTTGYTGVAQVTSNGAVTFLIDNTNSYPILLKEIETFKGATYPLNNSTFTLWYSSTSLSGAPSIVMPTWDTIKSVTINQLLNGYNYIFTDLNFTIPANTKYRFALQSSTGLAISGSGVGTCSPSILTNSGVGLILGDALEDNLIVGYSGSMPNPTTSNRWFTGSISFVPSNPLCSGTPAAGTSTSTSTSTCLGTYFTLDLINSTISNGITYQWESSLNGINWQPIPQATQKKFTTTQGVTTHYRCKVSCGINSSFSTPVVINSPALVSGNFTINSSLPTSATNFQTFTEAINYIFCGINGPVQFTVVPNSGPYNEQLIIPQIGGVSPTNTITIKGNGEVLNFPGTTSSNKAILTLNGADYVTIDSLTIDATLGSFGWGILFTNKADNNIIKNCTINTNATSTSSNYCGIIFNGSSQTITTPGETGNNNLIFNNNINGGYYGAYLYGTSLIPNTCINNVFRNNIVKDFYATGVLATFMQSGLNIGFNDFSRPNRTNFLTGAAILISTSSINSIIESNKIHNMFDASPTANVAFTGISSTADGLSNREIRIYNNIIYNIGGNGTQTGISNTGGDSTFIYHNTISIDDQSATTGAGYGITLSSLANGIIIKNNLISVTKSGTGIKRLFNFTNATSSVICDNNAVYFSASTGTNNNFGTLGAANFATFNDWKLANNGTFDQLSVSVEPLFNSLSSGDLTPNEVSINDICTNVGINADINNINRGSTTDPGAIVFNVAPCNNPATPGNIVSVNTVCAGNPLVLSLVGNSFGAGQTYTWERSLNGTSGWSILSPASSNYNLVTSQNTTFYYRCGVKCGASGTVAYTPTQLITSPNLVNGTFTINSNAPSSSTNFQTINDAVSFISCGINGPVTFNIVANSGPYNERVVIPAIKGVSSSNRITINGNGNILSFTGDNINRAALTINGTDYLTLDSLIIDASSGTSGWGIVLMNSADSNIIRKCVFNSHQTSTSTNYIGLLINNSNLSLAISGNNGNGNQIINNVFNGGYHGIYLYGNSANATQNNNNVIRNNQFFDVYASNVIAFYQSSGLIVSENKMTRPSRTNTTTSYGVQISTGCVGVLVEKNRIFNMFDMLPNSTATFYGIFISADGRLNRENRIVNNLIFGVNHNGAAYGIANSGGDSCRIYHNTIVLDDQNATTGASYGFYQTIFANSIDFRNNIISISRSGTGTKRCIWLGTTTSTIQSNNNILHLNVTSGTNNNLGQFGTTNFASLTNWQTANSNAYDQQSLDINPQFQITPNNDYLPNNPLVNGIGANVGISSDMLGIVRTSTPDPGAYEINISGCVNPPLAGAATSTNANVCPNTQFTLGLNGNSIGTGQTYQWEVSSTIGGTYTNIGSVQTNPNRITTQLATSYYRCKVQCNGGTVTTSTPILVTTPSSISGTFTINNTLPASNTNFISFTEALNYLGCGGIGGPVVLNVTAGSGPYNERIIIPQINGLTSTNTLTINGSNTTLNYSTGDANNRAAIHLNGADYVTIENLNIDVSAGAFGWGVLLTNQAENNVIKNCTINNNIDATSTNYIGIVTNGSAVSIPTSGNNASNNRFENNTIVGGYYGIYLNGSTINSTQNNNNLCINNTIKDFYAYGIYAANISNGFTATKNDIDRANRINTNTTAAGVYVTSNCANVLVEKNRVHNMFDGQTTSNALFYGIYIASDGKTNRLNKIYNNAIYDINSLGTSYGIFNTGADSTQIYHNTIVFDNATGATNASTFGLAQSNQASYVDFKNNLVSITRAGNGIKRCIQLVTETSTILSNYNLFYLNATGTNNNIGQWGTINFASLSNWQTANGGVFDANSIDNNPLFNTSQTGNFTPQNIDCDNKGINLGINNDINEVIRNATNPDIGAFEFTGVLPVKLISFEGKALTSKINSLSWLTANEINNKGFYIEHSLNGLEFYPMHFEKSKAILGNSNTKIEYNFNHSNVTNSINYYRLKQVDNDGKVNYSKIIIIRNWATSNTSIVKFYPNPTTNNLNVAIKSSKKEELRINITNVLGKVLENKTISLNNGLNSFFIPVNNLTSGIYFLNIIDRNNTIIDNIKFVKQ